MATMNVSLPKALKEFMDRKVTESNYVTASEYVRGLIRRDHDRVRLRDMLLQGSSAPVSGGAGTEYFAALRADILKRAKAQGLR
jgi:antitoxin ParD1/3/4